MVRRKVLMDTIFLPAAIKEVSSRRGAIVPRHFSTTRTLSARCISFQNVRGAYNIRRFFPILHM